ncbi:MAG: hypothetical protein RIR58_179, partial [Actinomycetota bacterium]
MRIFSICLIVNFRYAEHQIGGFRGYFLPSSRAFSIFSVVNLGAAK